MLLSAIDTWNIAAHWAAAIGLPERHAPLVPCGVDKRPMISWGDWIEHPQSVELVLAWGGDIVRRQRGSRSGRPSPAAWQYIPGAVGLVVVDIDAPSALRRVVETFGQSPVIVKTPGRGMHLLYKSAQRVKTTSGGLPGYDVKAWASLAHAPGSRHPSPTDPREPLYKPLGAAAAPWAEWPQRFGEDGCLRELIPDFDLAAYERELDRAGLSRRPTVGQRGVDDVTLEPSDRNVARWRAYLEAAGPAVSGQGGHLHTRGLALRLGDLGCDEETAQDLLAEWNAGNAPPWSQRELELKVADAYRSRQSALGWRVDED